MYKYTYHNSLSPEEQQRPATHGGDICRSDSRSSYDSDDDAAADRVAKLRQTLATLQSQLLTERNMLAKEQRKTGSMVTAGGQPATNQYSSGRYNQDQQSKHKSPGSSPFRGVHSSICLGEMRQENEQNLDDTRNVFKQYKSHLEDVQKMCDEELERMMHSIHTIKAVKRIWNELDSR